MATLGCLQKIREGLTLRLSVVSFKDVGDRIEGQVRYELDGFGFPVINEVTFEADKEGKILKASPSLQIGVRKRTAQ